MTCRKQYWVGGYRSLDGRCASCGARLRAGDAMVTVTSKDVPDDASVRDEEAGGPAVALDRELGAEAKPLLKQDPDDGRAEDRVAGTPAVAVASTAIEAGTVQIEADVTLSFAIA